MSACDDKLLLLNALADGELDAGHALDLEAHMKTCPGCSAAWAELAEVKAALRAPGLVDRAPEGLRGRVFAALEAEYAQAAADAAPATPAPTVLATPRRRRFAVETWIAGGSVTALAASLALFTAIGPVGGDLPMELVDGHVRSLQAQHLVDVETSDRHTVKPWFDGKIDFAPPVADLADAGYPLVGGRLDYVDQKTAAALVFRRRAHVINLFIWPGQAPAEPQLIRRKGYALVRWGRGGLVYWAVSDVDAPDLENFQKVYEARTGG
ncbi:anti-sigma factor family protein [Caulobacter sp. KR2-114]|uniref:anti-sigma factor family protein n=1 Tax=Caulobacter sp. KR2-114 TaxID=3400912 RepID=UPI003C105F68